MVQIIFLPLGCEITIQPWMMLSRGCKMGCLLWLIKGLFVYQKKLRVYLEIAYLPEIEIFLLKV